MMPLMCLHRLATRGLVPWNFSYQPSTCTSAPWSSGNFATYSCTCSCRSIASGVPCGAGGCRPTEISTGLGGMGDPKACRLIVSSRNVWHSGFDMVWSCLIVGVHQTLSFSPWVTTGRNDPLFSTAMLLGSQPGGGNCRFGPALSTTLDIARCYFHHYVAHSIHSSL